VRAFEKAPPEIADILAKPIKELGLKLEGSPLDRYVQKLYQELERKGIRKFRPLCYLTDEWGCPSGEPVIGIPFYLADRKLARLEKEMNDLEDEREILMYLRHEAGHCFNYAYMLFDTEPWRKLFGDYSKPYRDDYKPQPFSRKYVVNISGWYAQKHPDEDFAETFAVWLTPSSDWQKRYAGWGAMKKLQYVENTVQKLGRTEPTVQLDSKDIAVDEMEETVLDHYRQRDLSEKVDFQLRDQLDQDLCALFEPAGAAAATAETLVRAERQSLIQAVTHYSGVSRAVVRSVVDHLVERTAALGLTVHLDKTREYLTRLTSLVTTLAMNYLYTDRFFEVE